VIPKLADVPAAREVYVVKGDGPMKQALTSLLTTAGLPLRTFESGSAFLEACDRLPPGCVITNFQVRGMETLEFLHRLNAEPVAFPAIVISSGSGVSQAVEAMKAGAVTVLERPYGDEALLGAIRSALEVEARAATPTTQRAALAHLTPREHQVLTGLLEGRPNKVIARLLGISPRTVEVHRASLMKKTRVGSLPELMRQVLHAGKLH